MQSQCTASDLIAPPVRALVGHGGSEILISLVPRIDVDRCSSCLFGGVS